MNSEQPDNSADFLSLSTSIDSSPYAIFLEIVSLNSEGDWFTIDIEDLRWFKAKSETGILSINISPEVWF